MSAFSFYWVDGSTERELETNFVADDELQVMVGGAVVHVGEYNGVPALVVTSEGDTALFLADRVVMKEAA